MTLDFKSKPRYNKLNEHQCAKGDKVSDEEYPELVPGGIYKARIKDVTLTPSKNEKYFGIARFELYIKKQDKTVFAYMVCAFPINVGYMIFTKPMVKGKKVKIKIRHKLIDKYMTMSVDMIFESKRPKTENNDGLRKSSW